PLGGIVRVRGDNANHRRRNSTRSLTALRLSRSWPGAGRNATQLGEEISAPGGPVCRQANRVDAAVLGDYSYSPTY
ncbi:MAG TPA: hypothetical protein VGW38_24670, partial [Chloroflexota bacterium]|nr:hypothetical protein [Chloroflexota bacterium]